MAPLIKGGKRRPVQHDPSIKRAATTWAHADAVISYWNVWHASRVLALNERVSVVAGTTIRISFALDNLEVLVLNRVGRRQRIANPRVSGFALRRRVSSLVRAMNRIFLVVPNPRVSGLTLIRRVSGSIG